MSNKKDNKDNIVTKKSLSEEDEQEKGTEWLDWTKSSINIGIKKMKCIKIIFYK